MALLFDRSVGRLCIEAHRGVHALQRLLVLAFLKNVVTHPLTLIAPDDACNDLLFVQV